MTNRLDNQGWPVTTQEPFDLVTEEGLAPGSALMACSGSDVILSKTASAAPNLAKQKGRYVILLPGILSLRGKEAAAAVKGEGKGGDEEDGDTKPAAIETLRSSDDAATAVKSSDEAAATKPTKDEKPQKQMMGRIEGLATDTPLLKIPYPNGGMLTCKGQKVDSSSRFMMLSFKRGKVNCKDAVSTVICFGEPTYSGPKPDVELDPELLHYGGSERTVNGGKATKIRGSRGPVMASRRQVVPAVLKRNVEVEESSEDDEDSDAYIAGGQQLLSQASESASRRSGRRSTASKKSYADKESDSEEESSSDEEETEVKKKPARKPAPKKKQQVVDVDVSDSDSDVEKKKKPKPRAKKAPRKPAPKKKAQAADSDDDDDDDDMFEASEEEETAKKKPAAKRQARKQAPKKKQVVEVDDSEDSEASGSKKQSAKKQPARKQAPKKKQVMDVDDSDDESEAWGEAEEKPAKRKPARKQAAAKKPVVDIDDSDDESDQKPVKRRPPRKSYPKEVIELDDNPEPLSQLSETSAGRRSVSTKSYKDEDSEQSDNDDASEDTPPPAKKRATKKPPAKAKGSGASGETKKPAAKGRKRKSGEGADKAKENAPPAKKPAGRRLSAKEYDVDPLSKAQSSIFMPSPRRRRRRQGTPTKRPTSRKSLEDFAFDDDSINFSPLSMKNTKGRALFSGSKKKNDEIDLT